MMTDVPHVPDDDRCSWYVYILPPLSTSLIAWKVDPPSAATYHHFQRLRRTGDEQV